jgi:RHS repeat-associated protein
LRADVTDTGGGFGFLTQPITADVPPSVSVASNKSVYGAPASVMLTATANAVAPSTIQTVNFYANGSAIGTGLKASTNTWTLTWPTSVLNTYSITAVATDSLFVSTTSAPLVITVAAPQIVYYHNDFTGSPLAATDSAGTVLWKETYEPYGSRYLNPASGANGLWYTGKPTEDATGLSDFGARWYNPQVGRFYGTDPKRFTESNPFSFNRYAYGNNNPYRYLDPNGAWATYIHTWAIDRALSFLSDADRSILKSQQWTMDWGDGSQSNKVQYKHGLSAPMSDLPGVSVRETPESAWGRANSYVLGEIGQAKLAESSGNHLGAMEHLGNAIHTMQDPTSPSHRGFQFFDHREFSLDSLWHVVREAEWPSMRSPEYGAIMSATRRAWDLFRSSESLPQEVIPRP